MADLRAVIIGYGLAGRALHAPLVASTAGLTVATVVTADPGRAAQAARDFPDAQVLGSAAQLWPRAADHALVVIATPNHVHAQLATDAIERALPVVVDKPLALTAEEAGALITRAEQRGVLLTVFQNRRWDSDQLTLARLLAEGQLGEVVRYESRFERWKPESDPHAWREATPPAQGGGVLLDLGSHLVDQALVHFGAVTHVYAEIDAHRRPPADDDAFVALRHANGVISHLRASAVTAAPGPRLRVLGSRAAFIAPELDSQEKRLRSGERPGPGHDWGTEPQSHWGRLVAGEQSVQVPSERGDWPCFYRTLARALRDGGPPPVDPRDAVSALRVLEAARESAAERTVVTLTA